jgi:hypothetical protein
VRLDTGPLVARSHENLKETNPNKADRESIMTDNAEHWFDQPLYRTGLGIGFWVIFFVIPDFSRSVAPVAWRAKLIGPIETFHIYLAAVALLLLLACWTTGLPRKRLAGIFMASVAALAALLAGPWFWPSRGEVAGEVAAVLILLVVAVLGPKFRRSEWWP